MYKRQLETLLVHKDIAEKALPGIKAELDKKNVEIRGCDRTKQILGDCVVPAPVSYTHLDVYKRQV